MRLGKAALAMAAVLALGGGCSLDRRVFHFPRPAYAEPRAGDVVFHAADGTRLHGRFFPARAANGASVLYMHGNAQIVDDVDVDWLTDAGFHVLAFDGRGYGHSEERPRDREGMLMDARAAFRALRRQPGVDPARVGVVGWSMGGTFALLLAAHEPEVRAVVSFAAFASWQGVAHDFVPVAPLLLINPGLDPSSSIRRVRCPILIVHGTRDSVVRVHHGRTLLAAAREASRDVRAVFLENWSHDVIYGARPAAIAHLRAALLGEVNAPSRP